jgi:hypothetical protein
MSAPDDDETDAIIASIDDISETVLYTDSKEWDTINAKSNLHKLLINRIKDEEKAKREKERQESIERKEREWKAFEDEGDKLFNDMINNFENMLDGEDKVKHLNIIYGYYGTIDIDAEEVMKKYGNDIQKYLVPWIKTEFQDGRLFNKTLWKPFRDMDTYSSMFYAYKKIFKYENYYFQLSINLECYTDECKYCNRYINYKCKYCNDIDECDDEDECICNNDDIYNNIIHFELALYGWKDDITNKSFCKMKTLSSDFMMLKEQWNRK